MPIHSWFLLAPDRPLSAPNCPVPDISYTRKNVTIQGESLHNFHVSVSATTFARSARQLAQLVTFDTVDEHRSPVTSRYIEPRSHFPGEFSVGFSVGFLPTFSFHRSRAPAGVLTDIARRCGLVAAARAYDAGMSAPVLA